MDIKYPTSLLIVNYKLVLPSVMYFSQFFRLVAEIHQLLLKMDTYEGDYMDIVVPPVLDDGERKLVLVTHDDTTFDSNDGKRKVWIEDGRQHLRPKGAEKSIMVSQFLCLCHGHMEVEVTEEILKRYPRLNADVGSVVATLRTIKPDKIADGWWSNLDLVDQLKLTLTIFEILHPECFVVFALDNSSNPHKYAPDALRGNV